MRAFGWGGAAAVLAGAAAVLLLWPSSGRPDLLSVPGDRETLAEALADVADGGMIRLEPGTYRGSVQITRPVAVDGAGAATLIGDPGEPVVTIERTNDVTLTGLTVTGGEVGILVSDAERVTVTGNVVSGNELRGVRVVYGSARIEDNVIRDTWSPYGKGIHVANALHRSESVITGNVVEGSGGEGIIANLARVDISDNTVRGNGGDGIAVNEMSVGRVEANLVSSNQGSGVFVVDLAEALVVGNSVDHAGTDGAAIEVLFHATVTLRDNSIDARNGCPIVLGTGVGVSGSGNQLASAPSTCPGFPQTVFAGS